MAPMARWTKVDTDMVKYHYALGKIDPSLCLQQDTSLDFMRTIQSLEPTRWGRFDIRYFAQKVKAQVLVLYAQTATTGAPMAQTAPSTQHVPRVHFDLHGLEGIPGSVSHLAIHPTYNNFQPGSNYYAGGATAESSRSTTGPPGSSRTGPSGETTSSRRRSISTGDMMSPIPQTDKLDSMEYSHDLEGLGFLDTSDGFEDAFDSDKAEKGLPLAPTTKAPKPHSPPLLPSVGTASETEIVSENTASDAEIVFENTASAGGTAASDADGGIASDAQIVFENTGSAGGTASDMKSGSGGEFLPVSEDAVDSSETEEALATATVDSVGAASISKATDGAPNTFVYGDYLVNEMGGGTIKVLFAHKDGNHLMMDFPKELFDGKIAIEKEYLHPLTKELLVIQGKEKYRFNKPVEEGKRHMVLVNWHLKEKGGLYKSYTFHGTNWFDDKKPLASLPTYYVPSFPTTRPGECQAFETLFGTYIFIGPPTTGERGDYGKDPMKDLDKPFQDMGLKENTKNM